ncbi:crosslink repair DNA glycosylase YcaQ family protein [Actinoallomurus sp. NPDC052308]|uniref:DNA glycosylase AlkZ-like family protein n=1 Tax=Actinoallomurus sp. NPDC052308 TaxID=3155530 RepID=UPI0034153FC5
MTDVLSRRGLNRATPARQHLLERAPTLAIDAIEHLGGMQSQTPLAPYVGSWTRLQDFAADELSTLTEQRQVVRLHLMRNTCISSARATAWTGARCSIRCTPPSSAGAFATVPRE